MSSLFTSEVNTKLKPPKRRALVIIPLILILATAGLFFMTSWDKLSATQQVDVTRARMSDTTNLVQEGKPLFQAAGWIHADPYHIDATALVSGVITEIHAVDGDVVKKGQLLAKLNSEDFEIALKEANATLKELELNVDQQKTKIDVLKIRIKENQSLKQTAMAVVKKAEHRANVLNSSGVGITKLEKEQAELEADEKKIKAKEYDSKISVIESEIALQKKVIEIAKAKVDVQKVKIAKIELDISRCKIYSPVDGIIQRFFAKVGRKQMLGSDNMHSTTVAEIFIPEKVIVMVDVPLNDLQKVKLNQKTRIKLEAISETLEGYVAAIHGEADYQKNTLAIHVRIPQGHPDLRPNMLAQVEFLAPKVEVKETNRKTGVFVDKRCLLDSQLFVVSLSNELKSQPVQVGEEKDGWVEILSGINAGQKIVLNPNSSLKNGQSVKIGSIYE